MWEHGIVIVAMLSSEGDYTGIAHYITKEPKEKHKKRWSQSRNLDKPKETVKEIKSPHHELHVPKGYKELVRELYSSEITGTTQYLKAIRIGGMDIALGKDALKKDDPSPKRGKQKGSDKSKPVMVKGVPEGVKSAVKTKKTSSEVKRAKTGTKNTAAKENASPDSKGSTKTTKTRQSKKGEKH